MKIKKYSLKIAPYFISFLVGFVLYFIGLNLSENLRGLFTNLSAAFFAIPLIYLFYQVAQNLSKKRLNKEIFDYAKMQVDREVLSIINQLYKIIYPLEKRDFSTIGINRFLSLEKNEYKELLAKNEYLGFQVFKKWEVSRGNLDNILKNSYILTRLSDDQIISIVLIIRGIRYLEMIQKVKDLYIETGKKATSYRLVAGTELNEANVKFPDRYLLLQDLEGSKSLVADFGDFYLYHVDKLLNYFRIDESHLGAYTEGIFDLIKEINNWMDLTGREFLVDIQMFRIGLETKR